MFPCLFRLAPRHPTGLTAALAVLLMLTSCKKPAPKPEPEPQPPKIEQSKPKPPLREAVSFSVIPGLASDTLTDAWPAFLASCSKLETNAEWKSVCTDARDIDSANEQAIRTFFETRFTPHRLRNEDGADTGLATGYYEPLLTGSRASSERFNTPLHGVPDDLLEIDLTSVYPELKGMRLRGRVDGNKVVPYFPRDKITNAEKMAGKVLLWVDDPVDAFFLQIQGSGRVQLEDTGETVRVAFADVNGHPYQSIGKHLVKSGDLKLSQASAQGIKDWITKHPAEKDALFNINPRYVFFREEAVNDPTQGPLGALAVPLTPERSIAVDRKFIPLGAPVFLSTTQPNSDQALERLVMAQDTGGAIKGGVRADFFWGFGKAAGEKAGKMKQAVQMWLLLPKSTPPEADKADHINTPEKLPD